MSETITKQKIKWASPPAKRTPVSKTAGGNGKTQRFVAALKKRPNKWAIYTEKCSNGVIVTSAKKTFPDTEWTSRKDKDGTYTIYARYIGTK